MPPDQTDPARPVERQLASPPITMTSMPVAPSPARFVATDRDGANLPAPQFQPSFAHRVVGRPTNLSTRTRPMNQGKGGAVFMTAALPSAKLTAGSSSQARAGTSRHSTTSGGLQRANAERWFNESNVNVIQAPHTPFINSIAPDCFSAEAMLKNCR